MTWNDLDRIHDTAPLDDEDHETMMQLYRVLENRGALERFGIALLHSHFDLAADEVLVEYVDVAARSMSIRPEKSSAVEQTDSQPTCWRFQEGRPIPLTVRYCHRQKGDIIHAT